MTPDQMPPGQAAAPPMPPPASPAPGQTGQGEPEATVQCPNCGAALVLDLAQEDKDEDAAAAGAPSGDLRAQLAAAMGGGQ